MATVTFTTAFYGGTGYVIFDGEGIPVHTQINDSDLSLSLQAVQASGFKTTTIGGVIPAGGAGSGGKITVTVTDAAGNVLSPASENTFEPTDDGSGGKVYTFSSFLTYNV